MRSITIYCPDSHLIYDRPRLDRIGVGGGATTRTRMAYALAARGHSVRLYINCPKERTEMGVETHHYSTLKQDFSDILIASTSGGHFDLSSLGTLELKNQLKILLIHGVVQPNSLTSYPFDFVYSPSNFIRTKTIDEWGLTGDRVFVSYRGVMEANFTNRFRRPPVRSPFALMYAGHPSKGLEAAIAIIQSLRMTDHRFHLHVYGNAALWGETGENPQLEAEITYHGTIGQRDLAREMQGCSFSLHLQNRQEPFGMAVIEAMRAGCIVLASPVGAYPEIVTHGQNGFLVSGDPFSKSTHQAATDLILELVRNPEYSGFIRRNAVKTPLTWDQVARTWEGHWDWVFSRGVGETILPTVVHGRCNECGGAWLLLADGLHCTSCGNYQKRSSLPDPS
jgi:glycosyltransferase involved in cell wall biosynthesis